jgi:hypothetical protein
MPTCTIEHEISTVEVIELVQSTMVYKEVVKETIKKDPDLFLQYKLAQISNGINALTERLAQDLGFDSAAMIIAQADLTIKLTLS